MAKYTELKTSLRKFCVYLVAYSMPHELWTPQKLYRYLNEHKGRIEELDPAVLADWIGSTTHSRPRYGNLKVSKLLWWYLEPDLFDDYATFKKTRFAFTGNGCNPLQARPPSYIVMPMEKRIKLDQIYMTYAQKTVSEPALQQTDFDIIDDWED